MNYLVSPVAHAMVVAVKLAYPLDEPQPYGAGVSPEYCVYGDGYDVDSNEKDYSVPIVSNDLKKFAAVQEAVESPETKFARLAERWKKETAFQSSLGRYFMNPSYQAIIGMGRVGLPFALKELRDSNDPWFYALRLMAGEDVSAGIKDFETAKAKWLEWGQEEGLV